MNLPQEVSLSQILKKVALEFASYLSKSEPGLVKLYYFSNITHKCRLLVIRQKKGNFCCKIHS